MLPCSRRSSLDKPVYIALATYNGEAFLEAQVRSLQAQDFRNWQLLVRDDGSSDGTPALLARLAADEPRLTVLAAGPRLGVIGNFGALLEEARQRGADRVALCDQDDVWLPGKLSRSLREMVRLEATHGPATPLLVHADLEVVDDALRSTHPSFLRQLGIRHEATDPLRVLLVQNFVTGCTAVVNRALLDLALPLPASCLMHDWWLAQCAAARGAIGFIPEPVIRYRQHASNQLGAGGPWGDLAVLRARWWQRLGRMWRVGGRSVDQAKALHQRLLERGGAPAELLELVRRFANIDAQPPWQRLRTLRRLGIQRQRRLGKIVLVAQLALLARSNAEPGVVSTADLR